MSDGPNEIAVIVTQPITKGSVVLADYSLLDDDEIASLMNQLRLAAGHGQFAVMRVVPGARLAVFGPDDLVDALRQLAKEAINAATEGPDTRPAGANDIGAGHRVPEVRQHD